MHKKQRVNRPLVLKGAHRDLKEDKQEKRAVPAPVASGLSWPRLAEQAPARTSLSHHFQNGGDLPRTQILNCRGRALGPGRPHTASLSPAAMGPVCAAVRDSDHSTHHIFPVQHFQDAAQKLRAGLVVRLAGVVVQLAAELVCQQRQEHVSALWGRR